MQNHTDSSTDPADIESTSTIEEPVLSLTIPNFSELREPMYSSIVDIRGIPWRIRAMPQLYVLQKKSPQTPLGVFLQCCPTYYFDNWSCKANIELRLISQKSGVDNFIRKTTHIYTAKENDCGYSDFMIWDDIIDEAKGYIKDNTIKIEATVEVSSTENILNQAQFQKKIHEYIRLADAQAQRGFIDKALEVNANVREFCKDLDLECKKEVEAQLKRLTELKIKETIKRIEKRTTHLSPQL